LQCHSVNVRANCASIFFLSADDNVKHTKSNISYENSINKMKQI